MGVERGCLSLSQPGAHWARAYRAKPEGVREKRSITTALNARLVLLLLSILALPLLTLACSSGITPRPVPSPALPEPTPTPRPISMPADEASHDERLEWWYYSGHLTADTGGQFGFHFVIFQSRDQDGSPAYAAQFGITDVANQQHTQDSRLFVGEAEQDTMQQFALALDGWELTIGDAGHTISASGEDGTSLDLTFQRDLTTTPAIYGNDGWIGDSAGWTYYYSWPDMPAQGRLTVGGAEYEVSGTGWFDHQWGDLFVLGAPGGWQWMGLYLGGGETLMLTEARGPDGAIEALYGTLHGSDGTNRPLTAGADGITLQVLDHWTSPHTGAQYPSRWLLTVESLDLQVEIAPVLADQEITEGIPQAAIYWEGKATVTGTYRGESLSQPGYVELTGYVEPPPIPWRDGG